MDEPCLLNACKQCVGGSAWRYVVCWVRYIFVVVGLLVGWLDSLLVCWYVGLLVCWFVDWLACWLACWLVCWLVCWLACWVACWPLDVACCTGCTVVFLILFYCMGVASLLVGAWRRE